MKNENIKSLRSLKKGTKFRGWNGAGYEIVCIAMEKRGPTRDILIEGKEGTYSQSSDDRVEVIKQKIF